jgi:2-polyprenyl-3-methyl-5-hydroxy-6-metoxy-1,4-benzoquinol methylase
MKCRICGNENENKTYEVREMMYGYKDLFQYFQCSACNCLQIGEYPSDLTKYYLGNYPCHEKIASSSNIKKLLVSLRDKYAYFNSGFIGKLLNAKFPNMALQSLRTLSLNKDMNILDIGCGVGNLLCSLYTLGFKNLLGVDPFIENNIEYEHGLKIIKNEISDVQGVWDIVMFHHSLEHIPFQVETLQTVSELLTSNGHCVIRTPITSSYAWEHYGVHWVQLDAPRHFYLHSIKSMKTLTVQAGLELYNVEYDSTAFQFWGSEQYQNNIPLLDKRSYFYGIKNSIFLKEDISAFTKQAKKLNVTQKGDSAIFYLRKT